jgi:hypothetical protein
MGPVTMSSIASPLPAERPRPPHPPRTFLDTTYTPPTGRAIAVRAGGNLQAALDAAQVGDVIMLQAGAVFRGNFTLPRKAGSGWIVIRSAAPDADLPPPGTRITPAFAAVMPKLVTPNSVQVIQAAPGARGYRFIGIEFTLSPSVRSMRQIVAFGGAQSRLADTPSDLILDRCYIHGHAASNVFRGVLLNSASSAVIDSHIAEIHVAGHDSQAILGYNGPGPFKIANNFLEAAGENIMFGGGDPRIPDLVPSDIEIRENHLFKPLRWRKGEPDFVGIQWTVKNLLELKNAQRVLVEGNLLENVWAESQGGAALVLTPRNGGRAPWSVVQDVMFRNNVIRNAEGGFGGQSIDDGNRSRPMRRIAIVNNLWLSIGRSFFTMAVPSAPLEDVLVDHNTAIPTRQFSYDIDPGTSPALIRFQFTNNLTGFGAYGVKFPWTDAEVARWMPGSIVERNALVGLGSVGSEWNDLRRQELTQRRYLVVANAAMAGLRTDGRLMPKGPLKAAATDGKDIGVDFQGLQRVFGNVASSVGRTAAR